jgi:hypothetical protein
MYPIRRAPEERHAQRSFELLNLAGQTRLANPQIPSGDSQTAPLGYQDETLQVSNVHTAGQPHLVQSHAIFA